MGIDDGEIGHGTSSAFSRIAPAGEVIKDAGDRLIVPRARLALIRRCAPPSPIAVKNGNGRRGAESCSPASPSPVRHFGEWEKVARRAG
jgi:hypothetical protein